jgi:hypothetical protein
LSYSKSGVKVPQKWVRPQLRISKVRNGSERRYDPGKEAATEAVQDEQPRCLFLLGNLEDQSCSLALATVAFLIRDGNYCSAQHPDH